MVFYRAKLVSGEDPIGKHVKGPDIDEGFHHCVIVIIDSHFITFTGKVMLNKNTLGVKKVRGQSEATMVI